MLLRNSLVVLNPLDTHSELQRLLLDGLLHFQVILVRHIQRHLQFGDLQLHLLLDTCDFGFQFGFGFDDTCIELFDFNARLFTVNEFKGKRNLVKRAFALPKVPHGVLFGPRCIVPSANRMQNDKLTVDSIEEAIVTRVCNNLWCM